MGGKDSRHVTLWAPDSSGSVYFKHKKTFLLDLMALATADYKFLTFDDQLGSASDAGVWEQSRFGNVWKPGIVTKLCKLIQIKTIN